MYYEFNRDYEKHCFMIDYEQMLECPEAVLMALMSIYKLERRGEWVLKPKGIMPRGGDDHSDSWAGKYLNKDFNTDYYLNKSYMDQIPNLEAINEYIKKYENSNNHIG